ncbi:hypothetical protein [Aliiruegeria sabulilitoris]|uniref:hypothetical protein n=1 Tax=Aliiruegeria sabulilitoris TaxID=1510458 RepID=UPI000A9ACDA7
MLALAYRSGVPWNETSFANEEFDRVLAEASSVADADARRAHSLWLQTILRDEGVIIQPYWRSTFRHYVEGLVNAEMHPQFEIRYQYSAGKADLDAGGGLTVPPSQTLFRAFGRATPAEGTYRNSYGFSSSTFWCHDFDGPGAGHGRLFADQSRTQPGKGGKV